MFIRLESSFGQNYEIDFSSLADFYRQWDNHWALGLPRAWDNFIDRNGGSHEVELVIKYEIVSPLSPEDDTLRRQVLGEYFGIIDWIVDN
jgi:hypothetical protein